MKNNIHILLNYSLINNQNDDFMEMEEIEENPALFFTIKTLRSLIVAMDSIPGTKNIDLYRSTFDVINNCYKTIGGETRDLVCLLTYRLFSKSRKGIHQDILDFLTNQVSDIDLFYINKKDISVNIFSILLNNYEFNKACQLLDRYEINKSCEEQNPLLHNDNPDTGIYKPEFRSLTQQYCSNSALPMTYLNRQLLLLGSIYSLYYNDYENKDIKSKNIYWEKLISVIGPVSEQEQEFILSWMLSLKKEKSVFDDLIEKGFSFNANKGKALYSLYNSFELDEFKFLDFLETHKQNIIDNAERDNIELVNLWFESHKKKSLGSYITDDRFLNKIKYMKDSIELIYNYIHDKPMDNFLFGQLKDEVLNIYKSNYNKEKRSPEGEKRILNNYLDIEQYFEEIKGNFKEEISVKKRL